MSNVKWCRFRSLFTTLMSLQQVFNTGLVAVLIVLTTLFSLPSYAQQTPSITVVGNGPLVPQSARQSIPISYMNMNVVDIEILKVTDPNELLQNYYLLDRLSAWELREVQHAYSSVFSDRYELPKAEQDVLTSARIPIPHTLSSGWYLVVVKAPGDYSNLQVKHMLLTDIGIQARLNQHEGTLSVTRLSTGEAVEGADVGLMQAGEWIESKQTDEKGLVHFSKEIIDTDMVIVSKGEEYSMLPMQEVPLDLSEFDIGGRQYRDYEAYLYSNRDLVKPGESLPINILLRDSDGRVVSSEERVDQLFLTVIDPEKNALLQQALLSTFSGYYTYNLQTSTNWQMGRYTVEVRIDPSDPKPISQYHFQLEEFVPERMDLLVSDFAPFVVAGQSNSVNLEGRYLFGTPAAGNVLKTEITYQPVQHFNGKYRDFYVGKRFSLDHYYQELDDKKLSDQGTLTVDLPTPKQNTLKGPVEVEANFALQESGGAAIQRKMRFITWRDGLIPAIKPASDSFAYQSEAEFEIALLAADGQSLREGRVEVSLEYNQGPYYWVYEEGSGWSREEQQEWVNISKKTLELAQEAQKVNYGVEWGDYRLKVVELAQGIESIYPFYAGWYQGHRQIKMKPGHLNITTDKRVYSEGDGYSNVTVNSPMAGSLLLTLEGDTMLWSQRVQVKKGDVQIKVPLVDIEGRPLERHDIFLTATLTGISGETPKRYLGIVPLKLDRNQREIALSIDLPERIEPMKKLSIPIEATNLSIDTLSDTWVTVSLVDKGITNLTRFMPTDPYHYFFDQRRYSADIVDLYSRLYELRPDPFAQSRFGSDLNKRLENSNDDLVDSKTIVLMSQPHKLIGGKVVIELDIPDYNGEAQVVVTAFNNEQVGQLVQDNTISMLVVAELSVPRFVVPGDITTTTIDIFNNSGKDKTFTLALESSENVSEAAPSYIPSLFSDGSLFKKKLRLENGERWSQNVAFILDSDNLTERAILQLKVSDSSQSTNIDRQWSIPIRAAMPWVSQAKSVTLAANQSYRVPASLWNGMSVVQGLSGEVHISAKPILSVTEHAKGLLRYPYGCAEQTTSKAWPFLLDHPELKTLQNSALQQQSNSVNKVGDKRELIADAIRRLKNMQKENGGFGLWDRYGPEEYWLTLYITEFLTEAERLYPNIAPQGMLEDAYRRIQQYLNDGNDESNLLSKVYAAYLLSEQGLISYSDINYGHDTSVYNTELSRLHLIATFNNVGATNTAKLELESVRASRNNTLYYNDYGSDIRDLSLAILLLNNIAKNEQLRSLALALQADYIEEVAAISAEKNWLSTQERAALLRAAVLTEQENSSQLLSVSIDAKVQQKSGKISQLLDEDMEITNQGEDPIYLKVLAQGYMQNIKFIEPDHSFNTIKVTQSEKVNRSWRVNGKLVDDADSDKPFHKVVNIGDRVTVNLWLTLDETINNALIVDRIPAGFVLENPNLGQGIAIFEEDEQERYSDSLHTEYRHDRFVVSTHLIKGKQYRYAYTMRAEVQGEYAVPPIYIESMYQPEKHYIGGRAASISHQQHRVSIKASQ